MRYIIGIDEVGRGPLAGPVVVAAVCVPVTFNFKHKKLGRPRDSKKLSEIAREDWFAYAKKHADIRYAVAKVSPRVIDRVNITRAANRAAFRAWQRLVKSGTNKNQRSDFQKAQVFLDGSLYLKSKSVSLALGAKTVIKGDSKIPVVSLASIIAKVTRDRLMVRLAKDYPKYGFEVHKGYGTAFHRRRIKKHGPSPIHRLTFLGQQAILNTKLANISHGRRTNKTSH